MTNKTILVLMGGKNSEHEVSLQSAKNILEALSIEKYKLVPVGIDKSGSWHLLRGKQVSDYFENPTDPKKIALQKNSTLCSLVSSGPYCYLKTDKEDTKIDVVFPVLHGTNAEDGNMQGLLEMLGVPCVGSDTLSSATCFDKDTTKIILSHADLKVAPGETVRLTDPCITFKQAKKKYNIPLFIKPSKSGSSVGVHRATTQVQYDDAIADAIKYDNKLLIESAVAGRELECAIKGNSSDPKNPPVASVIGEVLVTGEHDFYDYEAKYIDAEGSSTVIPANLTPQQAKDLQDQALKAYKALGCDGLARVDMFLTSDDEIYINEINTLPGFTNISMYPKLWEATGLSYNDLLDELITLALERKRA